MNRAATRGAAGAVIASAALLAAGSALAQAPKYPTKSIRLLVTLGPGSAGDNLSRLMADGLSRSLGQQVVVDTRPGAGGNVAAELAARAAPVESPPPPRARSPVALSCNARVCGALPRVALRAHVCARRLESHCTRR